MNGEGLLNYSIFPSGNSHGAYDVSALYVDMAGSEYSELIKEISYYVLLIRCYIYRPPIKIVRQNTVFNLYKRLYKSLI